jgi:hypothetical protein
MNNNKNQFNIAIDEKVCYNCKHRIWAVAIGQGVRCGNDITNGFPKLIPGLRKTCGAFEANEDIKRKLYLTNPNQFLLDNLSARIQFYFSPREKTVDQILNQLINLQDEREDQVGAIMRIIKFQRANAKLTETQELELIDAKNLKDLIEEIKELKTWMET